MRHAGGAFSAASLLRLLGNPLYAGWVAQGGKLYRGEHPAIVDHRLWKRVSGVLRSLPKPQPKERNKHAALLQGLLRCSRCGQAMAVTCTGKPERRYRYYVCRSGAGEAEQRCDGRYVAADRIEQSVMEQLRASDVRRSGIRRLVQANAQRTSVGAEEMIRLVRCVIDSVTYDGGTGEVTIRLRAGKETGHGQPAD